jgi:hypothetical protein
MSGFVMVMIIVTSIASGPAWWIARRRGTWLSWDYASLVTPFALWFALASAGFGAQSLGNLIEPMGLVAIIPLALSIRVFLIDRWWKAAHAKSIAVFAFVSVVAVGLRAFTPLVPE